jgi:hypothetical protein
MADTEECAQRACFRMAEVTVIHSVTTSATGLTATEIGRGSMLGVTSWNMSGEISSLSLLDMVEVTLCEKKDALLKIVDRGRSVLSSRT